MHLITVEAGKSLVGDDLDEYTALSVYHTAQIEKGKYFTVQHCNGKLFFY